MYEHLNVILLCSMIPLSISATWLERKAEGWAWYEEMLRAEKKAEPQETALTEAAPLLSISSTEKTAKIRKDLEEKLAQAVLDPTEVNIERYMVEQMKWINQSVQFSAAWSKVLLQRPDLDATTEFPVSQYGIQLYKQIHQDQLFTLMHSLIPQYGLFFFYEGEDKSSQAFSMVVQEFSKKYGWEVIAISKDGSKLQGFKNNVSDNGAIANLGIEFLPSLFLINPRLEIIQPIAYGLVSLDQIENNVALLFQQELGK